MTSSHLQKSMLSQCVNVTLFLFANSTLLSPHFKVKCYVDSISFNQFCMLGSVIFVPLVCCGYWIKFQIRGHISVWRSRHRFLFISKKHNNLTISTWTWFQIFIWYYWSFTVMCESNSIHREIQIDFIMYIWYYFSYK